MLVYLYQNWRKTPFYSVRSTIHNPQFDFHFTRIVQFKKVKKNSLQLSYGLISNHLNYKYDALCTFSNRTNSVFHFVKFTRNEDVKSDVESVVK